MVFSLVYFVGRMRWKSLWIPGKWVERRGRFEPPGTLILNYACNVGKCASELYFVQAGGGIIVMEYRSLSKRI